MFGGIGFLLNANMLVGAWKDSLLVRLGPEQSDEALKEAHVSEFKITGRGTMRNWVPVEPEGVEDDDQLKGWVSAGGEVRREGPGRPGCPGLVDREATVGFPPQVSFPRRHRRRGPGRDGSTLLSPRFEGTVHLLEALPCGIAHPFEKKGSEPPGEGFLLDKTGAGGAE
jgi:hypothetical protein